MSAQLAICRVSPDPGQWLRVTVFALLMAAAFPGTAAENADQGAAKKTVRVVIDYGDGVEKHFSAIRWKPGQTVQQAMDQAAQHPRGIEFKTRGDGATALLTQIDDVANEGGSARNWIYRVNGQPGDRSLGIAKLKAGDTVLWSFETYR